MAEPHFELFFSYLSGIYRDIQRLRTQFAGECGVKSVHIFWLYLLREHPEGLSAAELAVASQTTSSLVSREIKELTESGLIFSDTVAGRRRYAWKFHLTAQGKAAAEKIDRIAMQVQNYVSSGIPEEELHTFYRVLETLFDRFAQIGEENSPLTGG